MASKHGTRGWCGRRGQARATTRAARSADLRLRDATSSCSIGSARARSRGKLTAGARGDVELLHDGHDDARRHARATSRSRRSSTSGRCPCPGPVGQARRAACSRQLVGITAPHARYDGRVGLRRDQRRRRCSRPRRRFRSRATSRSTSSARQHGGSDQRGDPGGLRRHPDPRRRSTIRSRRQTSSSTAMTSASSSSSRRRRRPARAASCSKARTRSSSTSGSRATSCGSARTRAPAPPASRARMTRVGTRARRRRLDRGVLGTRHDAEPRRDRADDAGGSAEVALGIHAIALVNELGAAAKVDGHGVSLSRLPAHRVDESAGCRREVTSRSRGNGHHHRQGGASPRSSSRPRPRAHRSPQDYAAGQGGLMIPAAAIGLATAVVMPAVIRAMGAVRPSRRRARQQQRTAGADRQQGAHVAARSRVRPRGVSAVARRPQRREVPGKARRARKVLRREPGHSGPRDPWGHRSS